MITKFHCNNSVKNFRVALRFGGIIKCIVGCITGYNINTYYRRKCKLKNIGFFASYLPVVLLPGFFSWGYHRKVCTLFHSKKKIDDTS